jgi:hypothetical protein
VGINSAQLFSHMNPSVPSAQSVVKSSVAAEPRWEICGLMIFSFHAKKIVGHRRAGGWQTAAKISETSPGNFRRKRCDQFSQAMAYSIFSWKTQLNTCNRPG